MLTSFLAIFTAFASVQVLFVVKLADFITDGAEVRGVTATETDLPGARVA